MIERISSFFSSYAITENGLLVFFICNILFIYISIKIRSKQLDKKFAEMDLLENS